MSRIRRDDGPGRVFHVTARVNWKVWHLDDDLAKETLIRLLGRAAREFGVKVLAGVLMANHFHFVLQSPPGPTYRRLTGRRTECRHFRPWPAGHQNSSVVAQLMRTIRRTMSITRQRELGISGRFWESAYDSRPIWSPLSLIVRVAYDHRNPVKQGIVTLAEDYEWSSAMEWATGRAGRIPISLDGELPFGLQLDVLRHDVLRYQMIRALDDLGEELHQLPAAASQADLATLLEEHGLPVHCGTAAAQR